MTSMRESELFRITTDFYNSKENTMKQDKDTTTIDTGALYDAIGFLLEADVYKMSHPHSYPKGLTSLQSNWTARGSRLADVTETVQFGQQATITRIARSAQRFFDADEDFVVNGYKSVAEKITGGDFDASHIRDLHRLGYLPVKFSALPEGTMVPIGVPGVIVEGTMAGSDKGDFGWVVNQIETALSANMWFPSTVATLAVRLRRLVNEYAAESGVDAGATGFMVHDFSMRGQCDLAAGGASGAAHLLASNGSDALPALTWIEQYYPGSNPVMASVPASEHSVETAYNQPKYAEDGVHRLPVDEADYVHAMLDAFPTGIVSIVADGLDYWTFLDLFSPEANNGLNRRIMEREGKVVIRPDSGKPELIINGDPEATPGSNAYRGSLDVLYGYFGGTKNDKGFIDLDPHIGLIYGDGMTYQSINAICQGAMGNGFSIAPLVFGVGSLSYVGGEITDGDITMMITRDLFNYAMKATSAVIDGVEVPLQKAPLTDAGKQSARGRLVVVAGEDGKPELIQDATESDQRRSIMQTVWEDGAFVTTTTFEQIKERVAQAL